MELEATTPTEFEAGERDVFESLSRWIRGAPVHMVLDEAAIQASQDQVAE